MAYCWFILVFQMAMGLAFSHTSRSPPPLGLPSPMDKRWWKETPTHSHRFPCVHPSGLPLMKPHLLLGSGWGCSHVQDPLDSTNVLPVFCTRLGILWNRFCELLLARSLHYSPGLFSNFILQAPKTQLGKSSWTIAFHPRWIQKPCLATDF